MNMSTEDHDYLALKHYFDVEGSSIVYHNGEFSIGTYEVSNLRQMDEIPVKFNIVEKNFRIDNAGLKTLRNSPKTVGNFTVCKNLLSNLEYCPTHIQYAFVVTDNPIVTLKFLPKRSIGFSITYHPNLELLCLFNIEDLTFVNIRPIGNDSQLHDAGWIIDDILKMSTLNKQQKILTAKRELIKHGFESNARL